MLRVWRVSGEELAAFRPEEVRDVNGLKAALCMRYGFPECLQQLLHNGQNLDNGTKLDSPIDTQLVVLSVSTPEQFRKARRELICACSYGRVKVARMLLEAGADKDMQDVDEDTALICAARNGHLETVQLLLEAGAHKDLHNHSGCTALMCAASYGHVHIVRLLLEAGANKDFGFRERALIAAASKGYIAVVRLLVEAGADKDKQDRARFEHMF